MPKYKLKIQKKNSNFFETFQHIALFKEFTLMISKLAFSLKGRLFYVQFHGILK